MLDRMSDKRYSELKLVRYHVSNPEKQSAQETAEF